MKPNITAFKTAAIVFACFAVINPCAQAAAFLWTGNAGGGDFQYSTGANWVDGVAPAFDWAPVPTFGSDVVNGTVDMGLSYVAGSVVVTSGATQDITFNGPGYLDLGLTGGTSDATIHLAAGGKNLSFNSPVGSAWGGINWDIGAGRTLTINGGLRGNTWTLPTELADIVKNGDGTTVLASAASKIGSTYVNGGVLTFDNVAAAGSTSGIIVNYGACVNFGSATAGATISTPMSLNGDGGGNGALSVATYSAITFTGPITLAGSSLIRALGDGSTINITSGITGTGELTFAGFSGGAGYKNTMVLSGASTFAGNVDIVPWYASTQITLSGGDDRLPTTALLAVKGQTGQQGVLNLNGNTQTVAGLTDAIGWGGLDAGARNIVNTGGTAATLTLNTSADQSSGVTIGGTDINGTTGNNLALVKTGSGQQTLTGNNTYSGATTISGGGLLVNGSHSSGSGQYNVTTGLLGGTGTLNRQINIGSMGTLAPGGTNVTGRLTIAGDVYFSVNGTLHVDIKGTQAGQAVGGYDQLLMTGNTLNLGSGLSSAKLTLNVTPGTIPNQATFEIAKGFTTLQGTFLNLQGGSEILAGGYGFIIQYNATTITLTSRKVDSGTVFLVK